MRTLIVSAELGQGHGEVPEVQGTQAGDFAIFLWKIFTYWLGKKKIKARKYLYTLLLLEAFFFYSNADT